MENSRRSQRSFSLELLSNQRKSLFKFQRQKFKIWANKKYIHGKTPLKDEENLFFCCTSDKNASILDSIIRLVKHLSLLLSPWLVDFRDFCISASCVLLLLQRCFPCCIRATVKRCRLLVMFYSSCCRTPRSRPPSPQRGGCQKFWLPGYFNPFLHLQTHKHADTHNAALLCAHIHVTSVPLQKWPFLNFLLISGSCGNWWQQR